MVTVLTDEERTDALDALPDWDYDDGRDAITRRFTFDSFSKAFAFMTRVAMLVEAADHHPEWTNIYTRVDILLTTHEAGGLSERDLAMAAEIDALVD